MNEHNTGGPAFPQNTKIMLPAGQEIHQGFMGGMTLRDYFAAKVLVTACEDHGPIEAAEIAYRYADAMLEARK